MTLNKSCLKKIIKEYYFNDISSLTQGKGYNINSKNYIVTTLSGKTFYLKLFHEYKNDIIKKIEIMNTCYQNNIRVPEIIKNKEGKLFTTKNKSLFLITTFYDGGVCNFDPDEIYSAGLNLSHLNSSLKNIKTSFIRNHFYNNLSKWELEQIKQKTDDEKISDLCDNLPQFYYEVNKLIGHENNVQLVHLDYNIENVLFSDNILQVILDFDFLITAPLLQSVAFACNRFSKNEEGMMTFLEGYEQKYGDFSSKEISLIPIYVKKEALHRINYILASYFFYNDKTWNFELDRHLNIIQEMEKLKWT